MHDVVVIGGGLAGLSAAVELAGAGASVAILEGGPRFGGRCYSYLDRPTGDVVDNGQHLLVGAYRNLLRYLRLIGTDGLLKREPLELPFCRKGRGLGVLKFAKLPAPLHAAAGFLRYGFLTRKERLAVLGTAATMKRSASAAGGSLTVDAWLNAERQSADSRACFWDPLCVSIMNERPERASAALFAGAIGRAMLSGRSSSLLLVPGVGQTELYAEPAAALLRRAGALVRTSAPVTGLTVGPRGVSGVRLQKEMLKAGAVISAVPPHALRRILANDDHAVRDDHAGQHIAKLAAALPVRKWSPIVSVHLWHDREVIPMPILGLIGRDAQWLFNRRLITGKGRHAGYLSAVISAAWDHVGLLPAEIVRRVNRDVLFARREAGEGVNEPKLLRSVVVKERRATFSATPEQSAARPGTLTALANFYLAGDWTDTGLPATVEGAVQSGFAAARAAGAARPG